MNDLNKNQLILLTLLVSFVTSIATGIITTTLLQEAPPGVTQVINRVVEKTIENVSPEIGNTETVKEVTVVVKEEDQVIEAIEKNTKSTVRIWDDRLSNGEKPFYGMGFLVSSEGIVVSAKRENVSASGSYTIVFEDGQEFSAKFILMGSEHNLAFFRIDKREDQVIPQVVTTLSSGRPQLGQSVIALDGESKNTVYIGRITSLQESALNTISLIETDIAAVPSVVGAPLINLSSEIIGIRVSLSLGNETFVPSSVIGQELSQIK